MPSLGELFVSLGFEVDDKKLKDFNAGIKETVDNVLKLGGITASGAGFAALLTDAANTATQLQNLSVQFGINQRAAQAWAANIHEKNPLDSYAQGLESVRHVAQYISDMQTGKGGNELGQFGGSAEDNTLEKINKRVRDNYQRVVNAYGITKATQWITAIYGTASAVNVLKQSLSEYDRIGKKGIIEQENIDKLARYNNAVADLSNSFNTLKANWLALPAEKIANFLNRDSAAEPPKKYKDFHDYISQKGTGGFLLDALGTGLSGIGQGLNYYGSAAEVGAVSIFGSDADAKNSAKAFIQRFPNGLGSSPSAQTGGSAKSIALSYFQSQGWSPAQAAGIVERLQGESGINPSRYGEGPGERKGEWHEAYGIAQWDPERQAQFAKWIGHSIKSATLQEELAFVNYELTQGNYRRAGNALRQTNNVSDAARVVDSQYEISKASVVVHQTNNFHGKVEQESVHTLNDQLIAYTQQGLGAQR